MSQVLLVTLGMSPAIVPEAYLVPALPFEEVHVLTTESCDPSLVQRFFAEEAPGVHLTISIVKDVGTLRSEEDHQRFEDALHRWILDVAPDPARRHCCLAGGFKTISAAFQRASELFGAAEVFHVLADDCAMDANGKMRPPSTIPEILDAWRQNHLHRIPLGPAPGWPQFEAATRSEYPLEVEVSGPGVRRIGSPDGRLRERIADTTRRMRRIAGSWDELRALPFAELATWSRGDLEWLRKPLEPGDANWIDRLPKVELHCHLGGFATDGPCLDQVRAAATSKDSLPPLKLLERPEAWPKAVLPRPEQRALEQYMHLGDNNGSALLKDPGCLRRQCQLLYAHLVSQRVVYAEVRCSPGNYSTATRSPWVVLGEIKTAFDECMAASRRDGSWLCQINLLLIATRRKAGEARAAIARHLALAVTAAEHWQDPLDCRVVGVDLAGFEQRESRAFYFREDFTGVHRCGLALTVHAGETDDAEGIWSAVFDLNARRLGHGLTLAQSPELLQSVAARGIGVELCPYANLQIRGFSLDPTQDTSLPRYPLLAFLEAGVRVSVNTDNIGISAASLSDNLLLLSGLCPGITRMQILQLQRNSLDSAFLPPATRGQLTQRLSLEIPNQ